MRPSDGWLRALFAEYDDAKDNLRITEAALNGARLAWRDGTPGMIVPPTIEQLRRELTK